ncbi:myosin-binding protein 3-like [Abrus precatorius]|uniref:Myosin-binding protein 3-like n=1 Tax=Abrus precatorius TaxID=3816 RepID=A0A8B8KSX4_ABRPR|nr:myosin-binding protein 3-like [Abrus precatorius]
MDFPPAFNFFTHFGCGFVLLRSLYRILNFLGLFLMCTFCFKVFRFWWHSKAAIRFLCDSGGIPRIRFCFHNLVFQVSNSKATPLEKGRDPNSKSSVKKGSNVVGEKGNANSEDGSEGKGEIEREGCNEDEVFDVKTLRKLVKIERKKANAACAELEKERTAAASSAEEAMAMILRLQREKSTAEIQATQFRRMAEEKLDYDQEMIESLQWTITDHETQKCSLEDQLEIYREELKQFMKDEEIDQMEDEVSRGFGYDDDNPDGPDYPNDPDDQVVSSPETEPQTL